MTAPFNTRLAKLEQIAEARAQAQRTAHSQQPPFDHDAHRRAWERWWKQVAADNPTWTPQQVSGFIFEELKAAFRGEKRLEHLDDGQPAKPAKDDTHGSED